MKIRTVLVTALIVVPLLLITAVGLGYIFRNSLVASAIETGSTYATGAETTVGGVGLGIGDGSLTLAAFSLANPSGFDRPNFLFIAQTSMNVDARSLFGDTVHIENFALDGLDVELSRHDGAFNYQTILNRVAQFETTDTENERQYKVDAITITNVTALIALIPEGSELTRGGVSIQEIKITDLGTQTQSLAGLSALVVQGILKAIGKAGTAGLPDQLVNGLNAALNKSARAQSLTVTVKGVKTTGALDKIKSLTDDLLKGKLDVKESLKDLGQGLLGGKKK